MHTQMPNFGYEEQVPSITHVKDISSFHHKTMCRSTVAHRGKTFATKQLYEKCNFVPIQQGRSFFVPRRSWTVSPLELKGKGVRTVVPGSSARRGRMTLNPQACFLSQICSITKEGRQGDGWNDTDVTDLTVIQP